VVLREFFERIDFLLHQTAMRQGEDIEHGRAAPLQKWADGSGGIFYAVFGFLTRQNCLSSYDFKRAGSEQLG
jgi:hypothetical protein